MSKRSLWKGPFFGETFLKKIRQNSKQKIKTTSRSSVILPFLVGKVIQVYNGKFYVPLVLCEDFVGHKIGEFVPTRLRHVYKIKKKSK